MLFRSTATNFAVGTVPFSIAVGDFNGDGKADIAAANFVTNDVSILLGNGAGSFSTATNFAAGTAPVSVAVGDFNGDGNADLTVVNVNSHNVSVLLGNGTGSLGAAANFTAGASPNAVAVGDFNGDGKADWVSVGSNVGVMLYTTPPAITSATYDAATGALVITGTDFAALAGTANDIVVSKLTLTGEGGATCLLTSSNVDITSSTQFTVTLNATDKAAVNQILNKNGLNSTGGTTYNLAAAEDWDAGTSAPAVIADLTGNGVTVSNAVVPAITSATYNAGTGALVVTGTGFLHLTGAANDITANKFTVTGEGGSDYTLTDTPDADITSGTSFTLMLSTTNRAAVNSILNKNGLYSTGGTTYNLAAAEDWAAGADAAVVIADLTGNGITVSGISGATVTTQAVSNISASAATGNGNITDLGVPNPTQYGVVWSTSTNPTVALTTKTAQGAASSTGAFTSSITGLAAITKYYVKAYATNTAGTSYGDEVTFTTPPVIIYVDASKPDDTGNGLSWATAKQSLQTALGLAGSGYQIWVKAGTYKPGNSRNNCFGLKNGVSVYGGFAGTETSVSERVIATNETILSGEIGAATNTDNCLIVVLSKNISNALLDGFTIKGGYMNGSPSGSGAMSNDGGGIYHGGSTVTYNNLKIIQNYAEWNGSGIFVTGSGLASFNNCLVANNTGNSGAGAFTAYNGASTLNIPMLNEFAN